MPASGSLDAIAGRSYSEAVSYDPHEDFYVLLGVPDTATAAEIKAAHRARIQHQHPDKPTGDAPMAAVLNHARDVLMDSERRAAYDDARRHHLAKVAAEAAARAKATATARAATRRKKRVRAAAPAAPKVARKAPKAPAIVRHATPPPPSVVDIAVENFVRSLQNKSYGKALGWFVLGTLASDAERRPAPRRRRRRRR